MLEPTGTPAALATEGELHSCMGPVQPSGGLTPAHQDGPREPTQVCTLTATLQWNLSTVEPLYSGTSLQWNLFTVEPLHSGTSLQWNLSTVEPLYSGTSLQWNLSTVEPLYSGQHQDAAGCPVKRGSLIQKYICTQLYMVVTADSVLIREVSLIQSVLY